MRKLILALLLVSAGLGWLTSRASAAGPPRPRPALSSADRAFIASLAAPHPSTAPVPAARRPPGDGGGGVGEQALCTASASCAFGGSVYCEGNNGSTSCSAVDGNCSWGEVGHVTCDGVTTWCGGECCPASFCTHEWNCAWACNPCDYNYSCNWNGCYEDCECRWSTCPI